MTHSPTLYVTQRLATA